MKPGVGRLLKDEKPDVPNPGNQRVGFSKHRKKPAPEFPMIGKIDRQMSGAWKTSINVFQCSENCP